MKQLLYWVTQENLIEFLIQSSLPYILLLMVHAHYYAPYPKWPCVWHEANMCCPCYMTSLYSRTFYSILPSLVISLMTCHQLVTDVIAWLINSNPSCSKNRKEKKNKNKNKNKVKRENKNKVHCQRSWHLYWINTRLIYPKWLCIYLKINIYITCYIMLFLLEPFTSFYHDSYDSDRIVMSC